MTNYFKNNLGPAVRHECLFLDNHRITKSPNFKYVNKVNTYYWWTPESKIAVTASKSVFSSDYNHMYTISISSK